MRAFAQHLLVQLQSQYPLPSGIRIYLRCYDRATLTTRSRDKAYAYVERRPHEAFIHTALQQTKPNIVNTMAHEYFHCLQKYVLNKPDQYDRLEPDADQFASTFTFNYLKEFNRSPK